MKGAGQGGFFLCLSKNYHILYLQFLLVAIKLERCMCCFVLLNLTHVDLTCRRNEEIDDQTLIRRLKKRIAELESEISFLRLSQASTDISFYKLLNGCGGGDVFVGFFVCF